MATRERLTVVNREHLLQPPSQQLGLLSPLSVLRRGARSSADSLSAPSRSGATDSSADDALDPALLNLLSGEGPSVLGILLVGGHLELLLKQVGVALEGGGDEGLRRRRDEGRVEESGVGSPEGVEKGGKSGSGEGEDLMMRIAEGRCQRDGTEGWEDRAALTSAGMVESTTTRIGYPC